MWGQVFGVIPVLLVYRIIPTRVGTRVGSSRCEVADYDHPHACGDKGLAELAELAEEGSSPRMWGQDYRNYPRMRSEGIIPTCVGTRNFEKFRICDS